MKKRFRYNPTTDQVEEVGVRHKTNGIVPTYHSEALGFVDETEVAAARVLDKQLGLGNVEYDDDCRPVFNSSADYEKYLKAHGYYNKSSCGKHPHFTPAQFEQMKQRVIEEYDTVGGSPDGRDMKLRLQNLDDRQMSMVIKDVDNLTRLAATAEIGGRFEVTVLNETKVIGPIKRGNQWYQIGGREFVVVGLSPKEFASNT